MPDTVKVRTTPVLIDGPEGMLVRNAGPDTAYYGGPQVTSVSNDGSLAAGSSAELSGKWFVSTGKALLQISAVANTLATTAALLAHEQSTEHGPLYPDAVFGRVFARRGAMALRFDDSPDEDQSIVKSLLDARYLPGGFAVIYDRLDTADDLTSAQVIQMAKDGHEIMCHSRSHTDASVKADWYDETVAAADDIQALGVYVDSMVEVGTWTGVDHYDSLTKLTGIRGRALRERFAALEAYAAEDAYTNAGFAFPAKYRYGAQHLSGNGGGTTLANLQTYVDTIARTGGRLELLFHAWQLDAVGELSTADFTTFLTYLQAARDAGLVDVLTPTGLLFAQPAAYKHNLLGDGGFEAHAPGATGTVPTAARMGGWVNGSGTGYSVISGGGVLGGHALQVASTGAARQTIRAQNTTRSLRLDAQARNNATSGTITARATVTGLDSSLATVFSKNLDATVGQQWTALTGMFGAVPSVDLWQIDLTCTSGTVIFDDVSVVKQ